MYLLLVLAKDKQVFLLQKMEGVLEGNGPDCCLGYCTSIREVLEVKKKFTQKKGKKQCRIDAEAVGRSFQPLFSFISFLSLC